MFVRCIFFHGNVCDVSIHNGVQGPTIDTGPTMYIQTSYMLHACNRNIPYNIVSITDIQAIIIFFYIIFVSICKGSACKPAQRPSKQCSYSHVAHLLSNTCHTLANTKQVGASLQTNNTCVRLGGLSHSPNN